MTSIHDFIHIAFDEVIKSENFDINSHISGDINILLIACHLNHLERLKSFSFEIVDINYAYQNGFALMLSTDVNVVEYLLFNGANINNQNISGYSALHVCTNNNNYDIVKLLLENNADIDLQDNNGYTALMIACGKSNLDIAKLLLQHGANLSLKSNNNTDAFDLIYDGYFQIELLKIIRDLK